MAIDSQLDAMLRASIDEEEKKRKEALEGGAKGFLPAAGGIVGGIAGGALGALSSFGLATPVGAVAGAGIGSAAGEALRQKLAQYGKTDWGKVGKEAAWGAGGELVGLGVGKLATKGLQVGGKALGKQGTNLAVKAIRPSKSQLAKFAAQHGDDMGAVLTKHGAQGMKSGQLFDDVIEPLQRNFDDIVKNANIKVDPATLEKNLYNKVKVLLESGDLDDVKTAEKIFAQYENILKTSKGQFNLSDITKLRKSFDLKVKDWSKVNPLVMGEKKVMADALRETVHETAEQAGIKGSKEMGRELSKLYDIHKIAGLQENLGRGNLPIGLSTLLGATAGGVPGGGAGALAGIAATAAGNSPRVIRWASRAATKYGAKMAGASVNPLLAGAVGVAGAQGIDSMGENAAGQLPSDPSQYDFGQGGGGLMGDPSTAIPEQSAGMTKDQMAQVMFADLMETGGKNMDKIKMVFDLLQPEETKGKKMSEGDKKFVMAEQEASKALALVDAGVPTGKIPAITGKVKEFLGTQDPASTALRSQIATARTAARNALLGANMSDKELESYLDAIFDYGDQPAIIRQKLATFIKSMRDYQDNISGTTSDELPEDISQLFN